MTRSSAYPPTVTFHDLIRKNKRQSVLLVLVMFALVTALGAAVALLIATGADVSSLVPSAVVGAAAAFVVAVLATVYSWYSGSSAILRMSGAREISRQEDPELFNVVDEMRIAAGLPMPRVYLIEETALNAFATGRDPSHAAVAITTALRARLNREQLQAVIAHEVAHIRHYDIRFALLMATLVGLIVFSADAFRRAIWHAPRSSRRSGKGGGAGLLVMLLIVLLLSIVAPLLAKMIQMAYSRQREYLADAGAVELTRNPQALADALAALANDPEPALERANRGTAHLFIVNPLKAMRDSRQQLNSVFASHPPTKLRIQRVLALLR